MNFSGFNRLLTILPKLKRDNRLDLPNHTNPEEILTFLGVFRNFEKMGKYLKIPSSENIPLKWFSGFIDGTVSENGKAKCLAFYENAKTNRDVWEFFCDTYAFNKDLVAKFDGYDHVWFTEWCDTPISKGTRFGVSEKHMKELWEIETW